MRCLHAPVASPGQSQAGDFDRKTLFRQGRSLLSGVGIPPRDSIEDIENPPISSDTFFEFCLTNTQCRDHRGWRYKAAEEVPSLPISSGRCSMLPATIGLDAAQARCGSIQSHAIPCIQCAALNTETIRLTSVLSWSCPTAVLQSARTAHRVPRAFPGTHRPGARWGLQRKI